MTIDRIKNLTYEEAQGMAIETMSIKEHTCFFVDFGDSFGYSILVFKNGKHIYYANDYELHHSYMIHAKRRRTLRKIWRKVKDDILEVLIGIGIPTFAICGMFFYWLIFGYSLF